MEKGIARFEEMYLAGIERAIVSGLAWQDPKLQEINNEYVHQTIIKSKQEDADQHSELRKHLQETLIEIINVKDSRKNELVECNKDLTRLQMSMKPLFIYANNI